MRPNRLPKVESICLHFQNLGDRKPRGTPRATTFSPYRRPSLPTSIRARRAALILVGGLVPALAGCGATPPPAVSAAPEVRPPVVAAASRTAVRPAFGDLVTTVAAKYKGTPYVWGG